MGRKLLVADDSVTIQKVIKLALSSEGYEIIAVSGGKEAIQAAQTEKPDVILVDVSLPGADAYEIKRTINQIESMKNLRFILMYSAFEKVDEAAAEEVVFHNRLIKPFDPSNLRKIVADLMGKKESPAPHVPPPPLPEPPREIPSLQATPPPPQPFVNDGIDLPPVEDLHPIVSDDAQMDTAASSPLVEEDLELDTSTQMLDLAALTKKPLEPPPKPVYESGTGSFSQSLDIQLPSAERTKFTEMHEPVRRDPHPITVVEPPPKILQSSPQPPPASEPAVSVARDLENDIRNLTDSTMRLTGIDAFSWNVDDSKKMKKAGDPPRKQTESTVDSGFFHMPTKEIDDGGSSFLTTSLPTPATMPRQRPVPPVAIGLQSGEQPQSLGSLQSVPHVQVQSQPQAQSMITRAEIEALIRKDVEIAMEKVIRDIVPKMAEELLRKEINKILSEP